MSYLIKKWKKRLDQLSGDSDIKKGYERAINQCIVDLNESTRDKYFEYRYIEGYNNKHIYIFQSTVKGDSPSSLCNIKWGFYVLTQINGLFRFIPLNTQENKFDVCSNSPEEVLKEAENRNYRIYEFPYMSTMTKWIQENSTIVT